MTTPIRQQLMDAVNTQLKTILTANGYNSQLGRNVFEWREASLEGDELPGIVYRDREEAAAVTIGAHEHRLVLEVVVMLSGEEAPTLVRQMIADVITCIGTDRQWSTLAEDTAPFNDEEIEIEHGGKKYAGISLKFVITYQTLPFDPYTQPTP